MNTAATVATRPTHLSSMHDKIQLVIKKLLESGVIVEQTAHDLDNACSRDPGRFINDLYETRVEGTKVVTAFSEVFTNYPVYPRRMDGTTVDTNTIKEIERDYIVASNVLYMVNPLRKERTQELLQKHKGLTGMGIISQALVIEMLENMPADGLRNNSGTHLTTATATSGGNKPDAFSSESTATINRIIEEAIKLRASDVHFEPMGTEVRVRFRINGACRKQSHIDFGEYKNVRNTVQMMAKNPDSGKTGIFDGMVVYTLASGRTVKLRLAEAPAVLPNLNDPISKFALRLLNNELEQKSLESLGMIDTLENPQLRIMRRLARLANGAILVTGPTGSGKTTTLAALLQLMQRTMPEKQIYSLEDPVEIFQSGISQIQINKEAGWTWEACLVNLLRQDPDIIMVGEVRELKVAKTMFQGALTGHLILSTLHTNSAALAIPRLVDIGVDPFIIAAALKAVTAQRLVPKLCQHCAQRVPFGDLIHGKHPMFKDPKNNDLRERYKNAPLNYGNFSTFPSEDAVVKIRSTSGCDKCKRSNTEIGGYSGRTLVSELLVITSELADMINKRATVHEIEETAAHKAMFRNIWINGLYLVGNGVCSFEDVESALMSNTDSVLGRTDG